VDGKKKKGPRAFSAVLQTEEDPDLQGIRTTNQREAHLKLGNARGGAGEGGRWDSVSRSPARARGGEGTKTGNGSTAMGEWGRGIGGDSTAGSYWGGLWSGPVCVRRKKEGYEPCRRSGVNGLQSVIENRPAAEAVFRTKGVKRKGAGKKDGTHGPQFKERKDSEGGDSGSRLS